MSKLITIGTDIQLDPEPEGHEFGNYVFDSLLNINTVPKQETIIIMIDNVILK